VIVVHEESEEHLPVFLPCCDLLFSESSSYLSLKKKKIHFSLLRGFTDKSDFTAQLFRVAQMNLIICFISLDLKGVHSGGGQRFENGYIKRKIEDHHFNLQAPLHDIY